MGLTQGTLKMNTTFFVANQIRTEFYLSLVILACVVFTPDRVMSQQSSTLKKTFLIIGCGRSGTCYISNVFKNAGYSVSHETLNGKYGDVSWFMTFENDRKFEYKVILHQIRNPIDSISSIQTILPRSWKYILARIPEISNSDTLITKCAKYWLYWNKEAEKRADISYTLESIPNFLGTLNQILGTSLEKKHLKLSATKYNRRTHSTITWSYLKTHLDPILLNELIEYAKKWDYKVAL